MSRILPFCNSKGTQSISRNNFTVRSQDYGSHFRSDVLGRYQITPQQNIICWILYRAVTKHYSLIPREFKNMTDNRGFSFNDSFWYFTIKNIDVEVSIITIQGFPFKTIIP